ncbi:MAG: pyruvate kinase [Dehalococcoidia bacterium]|nr:pyruvate kinase [Dehalococcoidia bacterium]
MFRKTKIVCTIGPASCSKQIIEKMVRGGMNVARLNFSHGTREEQAKTIKTIREVSAKLNVPLAILQDLPGPKLRVGDMKDGVSLREGDEITLTSDKILGDERRVSVSLRSLPEDVVAGDIIFLSDGAIQLSVLSTTDTDVLCRVIAGGVLTAHKGINVPGVKLNVPSISNSEVKDLDFGLEHGVDFVAMSFVREADEVHHLKQLLRGKGSKAALIAKIEKHEAVDNIDEIIAEADGIMIARGDLGVEIPLQEVPVVQKEIINKCSRAGKPVIVATQMLESMLNSPRPTRAEVSDVANAIFDGADAVMLSGETAVGQYPVETVKVMSGIAVESEKALPYKRSLSEKTGHVLAKTDDAISYAACSISQQLGAAGIVAYTSSGSTALRVSRYRPPVPILALTPDAGVARKLVLCWGVIPQLVLGIEGVDEMFGEAVRLALRMGVAERGQLLVITAGVPLGVPGSTNMIRVQHAE